MGAPNVAGVVLTSDPDVPIIRVERVFDAPPEAVRRAHLDADLFVRWIGPRDMRTRIIEWDVRDGGSWHWVNERDGEEFAFRGCFHEVSGERIVQTFTYLGWPDSVSLDTTEFEDLGDGRTRLRVRSLLESFESRDAWLRSGMETGLSEGYAALDSVLKRG